jgi:hypothetical protein
VSLHPELSSTLLSRKLNYALISENLVFAPDQLDEMVVQFENDQRLSDAVNAQFLKVQLLLAQKNNTQRIRTELAKLVGMKNRAKISRTVSVFTQHTIARVYSEVLNEDQRAIELLEELLANSTTNENSLKAAILRQLSIVSSKQKNYQAGTQYALKGVSVLLEKYPEDHALVIRARNNLAVALREVGKQAESNQLFELLINQLEKKGAEYTPQRAMIMSNLSDGYFADPVKRDQGAELAMRAFLDLKQAIGSDDRKVQMIGASAVEKLDELNRCAERDELIASLQTDTLRRIEFKGNSKCKLPVAE